MEESKRLKELKRNFESRYQRSKDKETLLEREIEAYESIFDDKKLHLFNLTDKCSLEEYSIDYSDKQIFFIRQFYIHFIVEGNDISELEKFELDSWISDLEDFFLDDLSEPHGSKYYYYLAKDLYEYLKWLRQYSKLENENGTIIERLYLEIIFKKYGSYFAKETLETWLKRFSKRKIKIDPINVEQEARPGTGRLKLIAILASIQKITGKNFDFQNFVKTHFGIQGFESTKSRSKDKNEFIGIFGDCEKILENDII